VQCDEEQINQLLRNVLGNALKFSEPKSRIEVNLMADQDSAIIDVIDNGIGIPEDELEHVFTKFALHQGEITASNNSDGGATIRIQVPLEIDLDEHLADDKLAVQDS